MIFQSLTYSMDNPLFNHKNEVDQALFLSVSRGDFENGIALVQAGANPNAIFLLEKGVYSSSVNLLICKASQIGKSKGPTNAQYISCAKLLKAMVKDAARPATLECKCLKDHKCPLYIALEAFKITEEAQILEAKCDLVRYLIQNGANIKFEQDQDKKALKNPGRWNLKWFDLEGIRAYLITKNFNYVETKLDK